MAVIESGESYVILNSSTGDAAAPRDQVGVEGLHSRRRGEVGRVRMLADPKAPDHRKVVVHRAQA